MSATELHGVVDVFDGADAFFERADGVEQIGHEKAIDDESGAVVGAHRRFPELRAERHHFFIYRRISGNRFYNFHKLHHRNRIEKMEADEALRALGGRGDFGDGQRRSVTGKNRGGGAKGIERAEKLTLGGKLLDDGLDDYIAILQIVERSGAFKAAANFIFLRVSDGVFLDEAGEIFLDALPFFVDDLRADLTHDSREAGLRRDLRDSGAHQATPDDANFLNRHSVPL